MKKKIFISAILLCFVFTAGAQTWGEWFNQKNTQRKYLLEQIAALKVYTSYLNKGYNVAKDGTQLIGDIRDGDFSLHKNYFGSLKAVNPAIGKQDKVAAILSMQSAMSRVRQQIISYANENKWLSITERDLVRKRCADLGREAAKDLDELSLLLTEGKLEMTDDERIAGIGKLYISTQDKQALQNRMRKNIFGLTEARQREASDLQTIKSLSGDR